MAILLAFVAVVLACMAWIQVNIPVPSPLPTIADNWRHWPVAVIGSLIILVVDLIVVILARRQALASGGGAARSALRRTLVTAAVSVSLVLGGIALSLPVTTLGALFLFPWVLYLVDAARSYEHYAAYALFAGIVLLQTGHLLEHVAQVLQLLASDGNGAVSHGIIGRLDVETVHFVWNVAVWLGTCVLVIKFRRNRWLWVAFAVTSFHTLEHVYLFWLYVADRSFYLHGGINGIFAAGGLVGSPLSRAYLHFFYNFIEISPLWIAFWDQTQEVLRAARGVPQPALRHFPVRLAIPRRLAAVAVGLALVTPTVVVARATIKAGSAPLCVDVAQARGLNFTATYGPTLAAKKDLMGRMMQRNMGDGAAVGDYNGDGYLDVYLLSEEGQPSRLYRNDPAPGGGRRFTDVTEAAGLGGQRGLSRVAFFADLTGDGRQDLVVLNDYMPGTGTVPSKLYRNNGDGTFTDVTAGSGFDPEGYIVGGASLVDFFGDGRLDIYVSYWTERLGVAAPKYSFPGHNRLYRNLGNFHFQDVTDEVLGTLAKDTFTSIFAPLQSQGRPDLFQAVDFGKQMLFANTGGKLQNVSGQAGVNRKGNGMGVAAADLSNDGLIDLFVTNIADPAHKFGNAYGNVLFVARRAPDGSVTYRNLAREMGVENTDWGWGAAFVDMRGTGLLDLYTVQGMRETVGPGSSLFYGHSRLLINDGQNHFRRAPELGCDFLGDQRTVIPFDYNRDGTPDLLITQIGHPVQLLENQTRGRHWLTVDLSHAGTRGVGARVQVRVGARTTTQLLVLGGSYLAGPPLEAYFGLGSALSADEVRVTWSDGTVLTQHNVPGDEVLSLLPAAGR